MERTTFQTDFTTLRFAYKEVKSFVETELSVKNISLSTKVENDLGCTGDDAWDLLEKFVVKYELNSSGFEFQKFFETEAEITSPLSSLITVVSILFIIFFYLIKLVTFGKFDLNNKLLFANSESDKPALTLGDMLVWYLTKEFSLRNDYCIVLKN
jgi:hypothetical protein